MDNCLIEKGISDIIWNCRCIPEFYGYRVGNLPYCRGKKLFCAKEKIHNMGFGKSTENGMIVDEAIENPNTIGNLTKPPSIQCLPSCFIQKNTYQITTAQYPTKKVFFQQQSFCDVASHILIESCDFESRKIFINQDYPGLCEILEGYKDYFNATCEDWPNNFLANENGMDNELLEKIHAYSKENLAYLHIMIQSPYITKVKRDVEMSFISYIANTGGLLGLCFGFSFLSGIEIFYWICTCCFTIIKKKDCIKHNSIKRFQS